MYNFPTPRDQSLTSKHSVPMSRVKNPRVDPAFGINEVVTAVSVSKPGHVAIEGAILSSGGGGLIVALICRLKQRSPP